MVFGRASASADLFADQGTALSEPRIEGIVIYLESREQDLVLLFRDRALNDRILIDYFGCRRRNTYLQSGVRLGSAFPALLNQGPESRVVQVVDVGFVNDQNIQLAINGERDGLSVCRQEK